MKRIINGVNRMTQLIDDLLSLSRMTRQKNPYENTSVKNLINVVLERIEFDLESNQVEIIMQDNMPTIWCDAIKMAEVFLNLINNGIKFSSKNNTRRPVIEIGYEEKEMFYQFFVKDNGIGIELKYHDQIFGIFKRLHSDTEYEGSGAGLSIVKRVVEDHGGDVWIESEFGQGAVFIFTISKNLEKNNQNIV